MTSDHTDSDSGVELRSKPKASSLEDSGIEKPVVKRTRKDRSPAQQEAFKKVLERNAIRRQKAREEKLALKKQEKLKKILGPDVDTELKHSPKTEPSRNDFTSNITSKSSAHLHEDLDAVHTQMKKSSRNKPRKKLKVIVSDSSSSESSDSEVEIEVVKKRKRNPSAPEKKLTIQDVVSWI